VGQDTEVLVVGGGPAGLAAAIAARRKGFRVTVADSAKPAIDKACGEGLLPQTVLALHELNISIEPCEGRPFLGIRFLDNATSATARFSRGFGVGIRRTKLHQKMIDAAERCGVELLWNTKVSGLSGNGAILGGKLFQAKWIVGADGLHSRVSQWAGLPAPRNSSVRFAQRRHYRVDAWSDCVEVYWGKKSQAYVTPLAGDETCVVTISRDPKLTFDQALREFPRLATRLQGAGLTSTQRGAVTAMTQRRQVYRGNVALIGDASGSFDAITGEVLGLSFRQALELAEALEAGTLEKYQQAHRSIARRPRLMARALLLLDQIDPIRRRVLRGFAKDPEVFDRLLEANTEQTWPSFLADTGVRLGWRLITA